MEKAMYFSAALLRRRLHTLPRQIILLRRTLQPTRLAALLHVHPFTASLHVDRLTASLLLDLLLRPCMQRLLYPISINLTTAGLDPLCETPSAGVDI